MKGKKRGLVCNREKRAILIDVHIKLRMILRRRFVMETAIAVMRRLESSAERHDGEKVIVVA